MTKQKILEPAIGFNDRKRGGFEMLTARRPAPRWPGFAPKPLITAMATALAALALFSLLLSIELNGILVALVLAFVVGCVARFGRGLRPGQPFGAANTVTLGRGVATALTAGFIGIPLQDSTVYVAVALAVFSLASDWVDGWIARRTATSSDFGARLDMEIDALLILVLSVLVFQLEKAGWWVLLIGIMRYGFIGLSWLLPALKGDLYPSFRRKTVCALQGIVLAVSLVPIVTPTLTQPLLAICLASLAWSFAIDCRWLLINVRDGRPDD